MKLRSIQFLRALAVLLVTYTHTLGFQRPFGIPIHQVFFHWEHIGAIGVDIFFVISGFIITYSAGRYLGGRDGRHFLVNRFLRLIPAYYAATLLFLGIELVHMIRMHAFIKLPFARVLNTIFLLPLFDKKIYAEPLITIAWTLSFEWLFYLFFFGAIFFSIRRKEWFFCGLILLLVTAGHFFPMPDYRLSFLTNPILLEFLAGIIIYWLYASSLRVTRTIAWLLLAAGIAMIICEIFTGYGMVYTMDYTLDAQLSLTRFFIWGVPSALIVAGCIFLEKNRLPGTLFTHRLITLIGDASYSIYLTHFSVFGLLAAVYTRLGFSVNPDLSVCIGFVLATIGGILFYKVVEAPLLRRWRRGGPIAAEAANHYSASTNLPI